MEPSSLGNLNPGAREAQEAEACLPFPTSSQSRISVSNTRPSATISARRVLGALPTIRRLPFYHVCAGRSRRQAEHGPGRVLRQESRHYQAAPGYLSRRTGHRFRLDGLETEVASARAERIWRYGARRRCFLSHLGRTRPCQRL